MRISNIVPPGRWAFDGNRQLTRADIAVESQGAIINIRWAKNLQRADESHKVRVPRLAAKPYLCPVKALLDILRCQPGIPNSPLVMWKSQVITQRQVRQRLDRIVTAMGRRASGVSFHALRRSAVTLAFGNNVSLHHIRAHRAWRSDAVWHYIKQSDRVTKVVPDALQALLG